MALQVWLPLTKDLRQQGLSDVTVTNSGATFDSAGKLGGCYNIDNTTLTFTNPLSSVSSEFSICGWVNLNSNFVKNNGLHIISWGGTYSRICISKDGAAVRVLLSNSAMIASTASDSTVVAGVWNHYAVTFKNGTVCIYINGILDKQVNISGSSVTFASNLVTIGNYGSEVAHGKLNDFRLYDHALSQIEVKQLSQGLVLHYPLNNRGCGQDNLFNANNWEQSDTTVITAISCGSMLVGQTSYLENKNQYLLPSNHGELIFSCDCETISISGASANFRLYSNSNTSYQILLKEVGFKQKVILNIPAAATKLYFGSWGYSGQVKLTNIKLENGSIITPYCPIIEDESYSNIEYDNSGFCNNGTRITNTITHSLDTAKYIASTHFNGTYDGILIENLALKDIINSEVTYAFWIKPESESGARSIYFGSYSGTSWSIEKTAGNQLRLYWNGSPDETCSTAIIADGIWQHICITKSGTSDVKVYINGIQKWSSTTAHNNLNFPTTYRIGRDTRSNDGTPYKGLMSDFRIYATALSADDVKSLYQNCATIDPDGTIRGQIRS